MARRMPSPGKPGSCTTRPREQSWGGASRLLGLGPDSRRLAPRRAPAGVSRSTIEASSATPARDRARQAGGVSRRDARGRLVMAPWGRTSWQTAPQVLLERGASKDWVPSPRIRALNGGDCQNPPSSARLGGWPQCLRKPSYGRSGRRTCRATSHPASGSSRRRRTGPADPQPPFEGAGSRPTTRPYR
ncbi:hypothetical protein RGE_19010 [Rubrivivax gelatinosus IL144]|uniref:Uncharacterized protein n=1 Tax=Rubrivivax gelatinosus (strain NBRC 100245 / IL144) TaxID=983917 RepID=I0HQF5_RUBGI|nr:hypothetical protein RGE_19010 [Rubrivivax gelatinosus IL144]